MTGGAPRRAWLTTPLTGRGTAAVIAHVPGPGFASLPVRAGTARRLPGRRRWLADLPRAGPSAGPRGRAPSGRTLRELRDALAAWADEHGPWWPEPGEAAAHEGPEAATAAGTEEK